MSSDHQYNQIQRIQDAIGCLKKWSGKENFSILFDSDIQGNGVNTLDKAVRGKGQLYFISIDENENTYGGYLSKEYTKGSENVYDDDSYVFSIMRNGVVKNKRYFKKNIKEKQQRWEGAVKSGKYKSSEYSTWSETYDQNDHYGCTGILEASRYDSTGLYAFGGMVDILVCHIGSKDSYCNPDSYQYFNDPKPLVDDVYSLKFHVHRIVVIQMN